MNDDLLLGYEMPVIQDHLAGFVNNYHEFVAAGDVNTTVEDGDYHAMNLYGGDWGHHDAEDHHEDHNDNHLDQPGFLRRAGEGRRVEVI